MIRKQKLKKMQNTKILKVSNENPVPVEPANPENTEEPAIKSPFASTTSYYMLPTPEVALESLFNNNLVAKLKSELKAHVANGDSVDPIPKEEKPTEEQIKEKLYKSEMERFVEISKYFSSPLRKTASYMSEITLVSFPNPFRIVFKRGGLTTHNIQFCNLTLEPVYIKLYKVIPDLDQIKYINLSFSRSKRIPPGLSFRLGFVYDDVNEKLPCNAKMIFVASRKTTTPCYQICEIDLLTEALKKRP